MVFIGYASVIVVSKPLSTAVVYARGDTRIVDAKRKKCPTKQTGQITTIGRAVLFRGIRKDSRPKYPLGVMLCAIRMVGRVRYR